MRFVTRFVFAILLVGSILAWVPRRADAADADSLVLFTGIAGHPAQVEIFPRPGADPAAAARELLRAAHVSPTPSDLFSISGYFWPQFLDHDRHNDLVTQSYNPDGDPTGGAALAAVQRAEQTWSAVPGATFRFAFDGTTTRCPSLIFSCPGGPTLDGHNDIGWLPLPDSIIGLTVTVLDPFTGAALESDVALSSTPLAPFGWFTDGQDIDVETVVLHEDGHLAGLGHSTDPNAVMYGFYTGVKRVLTAAETEGLVFLYPTKPSEPSVLSQTPSAHDFRVLAALGVPAPGGGNYLNDFEAGTVNGRGDVAFVADVPEGEALFAARNGTVIQVARSEQVVAGGTTLGIGSINNVAQNDRGEMAFSWALAPFVPVPLGVNAALFRADVDGPVQAIVLPGLTPAPGGGVFAGSNSAAISNQGEIAFAGLINTAQGPSFGIFVARRDGTIAAVARPGDAAPGGSTFLSGEAPPSIGGGGDVAFAASVANRPGLGVYVWRATSNAIEAIAQPGDPAPGGGVFERAIVPHVNARGDVLFAGGIRQGRRLFFGLYLATNGRIVPIAKRGDVMPDGWGFVSLRVGLSPATLNDSGDVAFVAQTERETGTGIGISRGEAVYASSHGALRLVAHPGSLILGVVGVLSVSSPPATALINERGDVVFQADTFGGQRLLLEAGPKAP